MRVLTCKKASSSLSVEGAGTRRAPCWSSVADVAAKQWQEAGGASRREHGQPPAISLAAEMALSLAAEQHAAGPQRVVAELVAAAQPVVVAEQLAVAVAGPPEPEPELLRQPEPDAAARVLCCGRS